MKIMNIRKEEFAFVWLLVIKATSLLGTAVNVLFEKTCRIVVINESIEQVIQLFF